MIDKIKKIKLVSSEIVKTLSKIEKLKIIERDFNNNSKKRRDNARNDVNYLFIDIEMQKHELHCLSVEIGIARYDIDRYGDREFCPDGWHTLKKNMRKPEGF